MEVQDRIALEAEVGITLSAVEERSGAPVVVAQSLLEQFAAVTTPCSSTSGLRVKAKGREQRTEEYRLASVAPLLPSEVEHLCAVHTEVRAAVNAVHHSRVRPAVVAHREFA